MGVVAALDVRGEGSRCRTAQLDVVGGPRGFVHSGERALFGEVLEVVAEGERGVGDVADIFGGLGGGEMDTTGILGLPADNVLTVLLLLSHQLWHSLWEKTKKKKL